MADRTDGQSRAVHNGRLCATTGVLVLLVQFVWLAVDHRLRFFSDSGVYLQSATSWLDPAQPLPMYRERSNVFTILWAPFVNGTHSGVGIIIANGVAVAIGAMVLTWALRLRRTSPRAALLISVVASCLPSVIYFQHIALSEAASYACVLVWISVLLWAEFHMSVWRFSLLGVLTGLFASLVRTSFTMLLIAFLGSALLVGLGRVARTPRGSRMRSLGLLVGTVVMVSVAGGAGVVAGSALQGAFSDKPAMQQLQAYSKMSGFNMIFKFGELQDCTGPALDAPALAVCDSIHESSDDLYDKIMWRGAVHTAWADSTEPEFALSSDTYGDLGLSLLLSHPVGALRIVVRDMWEMLNPVNHPRFAEPTTSNIPETVSRSPFLEPASADTLYRLSAAQDYLRLALLAVLATAVISRPRRFRGAPALLLFTWLGCLVMLAVTAYPTIRLLLPFDPLLIVGVSLAALKPSDVDSPPVGSDLEPRLGDPL